ncbi:NAD(P)-dependent oxidoreductase [Luteolibacter sp. LG18]|uniref:NAD(P)-dependent oxidoreductase n=1 Tax=Luteolibacter sp. LG18 TaxID=2819286 RepID=UPI002B28B4D7|nr:3-hydroxyisobutyrate dehydrogenase [Luteolibacter sp. LG18]
MSTVELEKAPAAVLGLGIIGSRAYGRLRDAGWGVKAWNRTPKGLPGEVSSALEAIEGARWISIYLKDSPAARATVEAIVPGLKPGMVVLNHSTLDVETTRWIAAQVAATGADFLDVPFTGSKVASENGQLVYYTSGDPALLAEVEPYLRVTAKDLIPCGEVGAATIVKLATNLISACTVQALAEALAVATAHGISAENFIGAVSKNACASVLSGMKLPTMAGGDFDTHFSLGNMEKDSRYVRALAAEAGLETPAIDAVSARMSALCADGLADLDYSALAKAYQ